MPVRFEYTKNHTRLLAIESLNFQEQQRHQQQLKYQKSLNIVEEIENHCILFGPTRERCFIRIYLIVNVRKTQRECYSKLNKFMTHNCWTYSIVKIITKWKEKKALLNYWNRMSFAMNPHMAVAAEAAASAASAGRRSVDEIEWKTKLKTKTETIAQNTVMARRSVYFQMHTCLNSTDVFITCYGVRKPWNETHSMETNERLHNRFSSQIRSLKRKRQQIT